MIRAGKLRHSVTAQRQVSTTNEYGEQENVWRNLACVRASIEPLRSSEAFTAGIEMSETVCRIRMRYNPKLCNLGAEDRIVAGDDVYDIVAPLVPWELKREMVVMASRRPASAEGRCSG